MYAWVCSLSFFVVHVLQLAVTIDYKSGKKKDATTSLGLSIVLEKFWNNTCVCVHAKYQKA